MGEPDDRWTQMRVHAEKVADELRSEAASAGGESAGWRGAALEWATTELTADTHVCDYASVPECEDKGRDGYLTRCSSAYWRSHSAHVAGSMARLAEAVGADSELWELVGHIHDADYVRAPHHVREVAIAAGHPMTLILALERLGAPASVRLAVLEHAAHTRLRPSSALSGALVLADEHSTMSAFGDALVLTAPGSDAFLDRLKPAPHRLNSSGYHRPDMTDRANVAAEVLLGL